MPDLGSGGDLSGVTEDDMKGGSWKALEPGTYRFMVEGSDYKETKKGNGMRLGLKLTSLESNYPNAKLYEYLTLVHPNPDTVKIARAKLKALALAVGHPAPDHIARSEELHGIPMLVKVGRKKAQEGFGDANGFDNYVVDYFPMSAASSGSAASPPAYTPDDIPPPSDDDIPF